MRPARTHAQQSACRRIRDSLVSHAHVRYTTRFTPMRRNTHAHIFMQALSLYVYVCVRAHMNVFACVCVCEVTGMCGLLMYCRTYMHEYIHTYISHSMYLTMRVCVCVHVWQDIQHAHTHMIFRVCPLMQLATNYERRMKVFCFASISSSGRQRERERYSERWQKTHILDSHMPILSHTHTYTQQAKFLFGFCQPFLFPFLLSPVLASFCRLFFAPFVFAFFLYFFHCVAVAWRFLCAPPPLSLSSLVWPPSRQI